MKVAFIGMGTMRAAMALNILKAGFAVTVHNRNRQREETVAQAGARRAGSPKEAARGGGHRHYLRQRHAGCGGGGSR